MSMTAAQLATLKSVILANQTWAALPLTSGAALQIATDLNAVASPDFWVWRSSVSKGELTNSTSVDGTTFNWTGAGFITRAQGERDAWRELFDQSGNVNASLSQVRQAFSDIFSGATAPAPANRTHLSTVARRKATLAEKSFATGTGSTASPALMGFEGTVTSADVQAARELP